MSGIITAVSLAVSTVATIAVAALPDAQALLTPLTEGNDHMIVAASVIATIPILGIMSILAASGRE